MATPLNQLLKTTELNKKLGGSNTGNEILNADEIISNWSNGVYIVGSLTGHVIPDNGEVWPVMTFRFGNSKESALNGASRMVNVRNTGWTSTYEYSINTTSTYFYDGEDTVSDGYYMIVSGSTPYQWYFTSSGEVTQKGTYTPHLFNWNYNGDPNLQYAEIAQSSSYQYIPYTTNETSVSVITTRKYDRDNVLGGNDNLGASIYSKQVRFKRSTIDNDYPFTEVVIRGTYDSIQYYHNFLLAPPTSFWVLNGSNITDVSGNGATLSPTIGTNMDSYSMSTSDSWISINNSNNNITVSSNPNNSTRTATINLTGYIDTSIGGEEINGIYPVEAIDYSYIKTDTSFTITQNAQSVTIYILIEAQDPSECWACTDSSSFNNTINVPETIYINDIFIQRGNQTYYGYCTIPQGSHYGTISWDSQPPNEFDIYDGGNIRWENNTAPDGYELGSQSAIFMFF